ncbi:MAG: hypothetical protein V3V05_07730 [Pontiella sp.]
MLFLTVIFMLVSSLAPTFAAQGTFYDFLLVDEGAVLAREAVDTSFPSVIRVPSWIANAEKADPSAVYYMYYGNHGGRYIYMKWADNIRPMDGL